jgi:hypothetical protein
MDEGRKRVLAILTAILVAPRAFKSVNEKLKDGSYNWADARHN